MMKRITFLMVAISLICKSSSFWPPEFKVDLNQGEEFVIANGFDENYDDDEMIKPRDLEEFHLEKDEDKYFRIHKLAHRKNKNKVDNPFVLKPTQKAKELEESDYGLNEPAYAGFFDSHEIMDVEDQKNTYYTNEKVKKSVEDVVRKKRLELMPVEKRELNESDYNYEELKAEYDAEVEKSKAKNDTLKYVEVKEDESVKDAVKNIVGVEKLPTNCTKEEENGIGLRAAECFFADMNTVKSKEDQMKLASKLGKLILIWFMVYVTIAIPCWCQKGWCCCCFRCKFCRPKERIDEAKKFLAINPPGVLHENGKRLAYRPTQFEKYAQKRLEQAIMKL